MSDQSSGSWRSVRIGDSGSPDAKELRLALPNWPSMRVAECEGERLRIFVPSGALLRVTSRPGSTSARPETSASLDSDHVVLLDEGQRATLELAGLGVEIEWLPEVRGADAVGRRSRAVGFGLVSTVLVALFVALVVPRAMRTIEPGDRSADRIERLDVGHPLVAALITERSTLPPGTALRRPAQVRLPAAVATPPPRDLGMASSVPPAQVPEPARPWPAVVDGAGPVPTPPPGRSPTRPGNPSSSGQEGEATEVAAEEQPAPPDEDELAAIRAEDERERMRRAMRRQVGQLGACYDELGLAPGAGPPVDPATRARLADCLARRAQLAAAEAAARPEVHAVVDLDMEIDTRAGTARYSVGQFVIPIAP